MRDHDAFQSSFMWSRNEFRGAFAFVTQTSCSLQNPATNTFDRADGVSVPKWMKSVNENVLLKKQIMEKTLPEIAVL